MAVYKTPKNLTLGYSPSVKPTIPVVIDWSNPLSRGLVNFAQLGIEHSKSYLGLNTTYLNNDLKPNYLTTSAVDEGAIIPVPNLSSFSEATFIIKYGNITGQTISNSRVLNVYTSAFDDIRIYKSNTNQITTAWDDGTTTNQVTTAIESAVNTVAISHTGSYQKTYVNGALKSGGADSFNFAAISDNNIRVADITFLTNLTLFADFYYVMAFNRALSDSEIKSLHENPYQLLKPQIETFYYTAGSGTTDNLLANDVESSSEVTSPAITQVHALTATSVQSTSNVTTATLTQVHALLANDIESASEVTTPTLTEGTHNLLANDVESNSELTTPTLAQIHNLLATSVQSLSQVSSPTLNRPDTLITETTATFALVSKTLTIKNRTMTISVD